MPLPFHTCTVSISQCVLNVYRRILHVAPILIQTSLLTIHDYQQHPTPRHLDRCMSICSNFDIMCWIVTSTLKCLWSNMLLHIPVSVLWLCHSIQHESIPMRTQLLHDVNMLMSHWIEDIPMTAWSHTITLWSQREATICSCWSQILCSKRFLEPDHT